MATLDVTEILEADLADWRPMVKRLQARYRTGDFATGVAFLADVGEAAEEANHHPDVRLAYTHVDVILTSHDAGGVTQRDIDLARTITDLAAARRLTPEPHAITASEIALNAVDHGAIGPFWSAILTGDASVYSGDEVIDPSGQSPVLWFQPTGPRTAIPEMCFHLDVWVPPDQLDARIEAAVAAGGTLVDETEKPSFVVLEDAEGNKACLCTALDRS